MELVGKLKMETEAFDRLLDALRYYEMIYKAAAQQSATLQSAKTGENVEEILRKSLRKFDRFVQGLNEAANAGRLDRFCSLVNAWVYYVHLRDPEHGVFFGVDKNGKVHFSGTVDTSLPDSYRISY